ncbi:uncharacterized protein LOC143764919 [Ranitomeya variabilis]|uniref:uncharacterized protein LOC143764919 n=1 Tax=Ranitomeya variabilis TaxID=490064 RepID=UPI0040571C19
MDDHPPPTSPDGSIKDSTPERFQIPYSDDWPGDDDDVPQEDDDDVPQEDDDDVPQEDDDDVPQEDDDDVPQEGDDDVPQEDDDGVPQEDKDYDDANHIPHNDHDVQHDDDDQILQDNVIDDLVIVKVEDIEGDEEYIRTEGHHTEDYSTTDISQAKAMIRKQLTTQQRDLIVESYQSGEGYKKISKSLDISRNTVKTVIKKWLKFGTTVTLPRTGRPSKIDVRTRRKLVREAAKRPRATLKELQEFLASTGCVLHVTTISRILHVSGL